MSMELKGKMKGCMSENEMSLQWGELRKGERNYRAVSTLELVFIRGNIEASSFPLCC